MRLISLLMMMRRKKKIMKRNKSKINLQYCQIRTIALKAWTRNSPRNMNKEERRHLLELVEMEKEAALEIIEE